MTASDIPLELKGIATSLRNHLGSIIDRTALLQDLLVALEAWYVTFRNARYEDIRERYLALMEGRGAPVRVALPTGELQGTIVGISDEGSLLLQLPTGEEKSVHMGEITRVRTHHVTYD